MKVLQRKTLRILFCPDALVISPRGLHWIYIRRSVIASAIAEVSPLMRRTTSWKLIDVLCRKASFISFWLELRCSKYFLLETHYLGMDLFPSKIGYHWLCFQLFSWKCLGSSADIFAKVLDTLQGLSREDTKQLLRMVFNQVTKLAGCRSIYLIVDEAQEVLKQISAGAGRCTSITPRGTWLMLDRS